MFTSIRLILLFIIGLVFLYAGLLNPMVMVSPAGSSVYKNYGVGGIRASELLPGLVLTRGSAWLIRRDYRRFRRPPGPSA